MIIDTLANLKDYATVHRDMPAVIDFLLTHNLTALENGRIKLGDGFINIQTINPKTKEEARLESHQKMIDIQIPIDGDEIMGFTSLCDAVPATYNEEKDITFHPGSADSYLHVRKGMFAVFFPQDVHAPGITNISMRKIVVKLPVLR